MHSGSKHRAACQRFQLTSQQTLLMKASMSGNREGP
jgi:hypothetical protein